MVDHSDLRGRSKKVTTASNSAIVLVNGVIPGNNDNVTWQVGGSATVGTGTGFVGNILANTSITLNAGATVGILGIPTVTLSVVRSIADCP